MCNGYNYLLLQNGHVIKIPEQIVSEGVTFFSRSTTEVVEACLFGAGVFETFLTFLLETRLSSSLALRIYMNW